MKKLSFIFVVFLIILAGCSSSEYFVREKFGFAEYYVRDLKNVGPDELPIELIYVHDTLAKIIKDQKGNIFVSSPNAMIPKLLRDDSGSNLEHLYLQKFHKKVSERNFKSEKDFLKYFRTVWIGGHKYFILSCDNKRMFLIPVKGAKVLFYRKKIYLTNSKIYLFTPKDEDPPTFSNNLVQEKITKKYLAQKKYYHVKKGDTLYRIAKKYKTTVGDLQALNFPLNPNKIYPGQKIRVK